MKNKIINLIKNTVISFKKHITNINFNDFIKVLTLIIQLGLLVIAYKGLSLWQEEVKGLDRYNTAREGLTAIYRLRDELATVKSSDLIVDITVLRGGVTFDSEGEGKYKDKGHWTDSAFKYHLEELRKAIDDYYTLIPKIEVVIGDQTFNESNPRGIAFSPGLSVCDTTYKVNLVFNDLPKKDFFYNGCMEDQFVINIGGVIFNETNPNGVVFLPALSGCDTLYNVFLTFDSLFD